MNYESRDYHRHIYISYVRLFWVGGTCECLTISAKIYANLKLWIFYSFLLHVHTPAVNVSLSCCSLLYHLRFYLFPIFGECINKSLKGSLFGEEQKLNESATDISEQKARDIYDNSSLLSHRRFSAHLKKEENNFVSNCFRYYSKQKSTTASKRGRKEGKLTIGATQKTKVLLHHLSNLFHYF